MKNLIPPHLNPPISPSSLIFPNKQPKTMLINSLPSDVVFQILIRLPTKSLLQIRCVCKSWYSLITTSEFISLHLNHTHQFNNPTVLFRRLLLEFRKETYTLHNDNEQFHELETLYFPFISHDGCFTILGCVNGLVCLWDFSVGNIMLWNPCVRKCLILPKCSDDVKCMGRVFGFGYDELADDYKVVRSANCHNGDACCDHGGCGAGVFSLRARSWKRVGCVPDWNTPSRPRTVGGVIHRIAELDENLIKIVTFDLCSEVCSEIACPECVRNDFPPCKTELSIFRYSLALIHPRNDKHYDIWVLRENGKVKSWSKLFSIDLDNTVWEQFMAGFSVNGLAVLVGRGSLAVNRFLDSPVVVNLQQFEPEFHWHVESFVESLVLLQEGEDVDSAAQKFGGGEKVDADEAAMTIIID